MSEKEFLNLADQVLITIALALDRLQDIYDVDVEYSRNGNVLKIELIEQNAQIIVNVQEPMQEIWVAAASGGFHYRYSAPHWVNTRDSSELFAALTQLITEQGRLAVKPDNIFLK